MITFYIKFPMCMDRVTVVDIERFKLTVKQKMLADGFIKSPRGEPLSIISLGFRHNHCGAHHLGQNVHSIIDWLEGVLFEDASDIDDIQAWYDMEPECCVCLTVGKAGFWDIEEEDSE